MARVTAVLAAVLSLTAAAPAARAAGGCEVPDGAKVNARNEHAVVYTRPLPSPYGDQPYRFTGCVEGVGRPFEIEHLEGDSVDGIVLNGYELAYVHRSDDDYFGPRFFASVSMLDLRHPEVRSGAGGAVGSSPPSIPRLVVTGDGAVAYSIAWTEFGGDAKHRELRATDSRGFRTLDSGAGLALDSLVRRGRRVAWTHSGEERSARLASMRRIGRCRLERGPDVRAMNVRTLVYTSDATGRYAGQGHSAAYACDRMTGEQQRFVYYSGYAGFDDDFRLNGRYVAWSETSYVDNGGGAVDAFVFDLEARKRKSSAGVDAYAGDEEGPDPEIGTLALSPNGDIAWTLLTYNYVSAGYPHDPVTERRLVAAYDRYGYVQLDHGRRTDLSSLRLRHGRVHWTRGGKHRSARLWPSGRRVPCQLPSNANVLVRTVNSVAYRYPTASGRRAPTRVDACFLRTGRRTALGESRRHASRVVGTRLAGPYVAYGLEALNDEGHAERALVRSVDLRSGALRWSSRTWRPGEHGRTFGIPNVALAPDGGFAYIVEGYGTPTATGRVRVRWSGGELTVDKSDAIYAPDLSFDGRVVRWWADSRPHERELP